MKSASARGGEKSINGVLPGDENMPPRDKAGSLRDEFTRPFYVNRIRTIIS